MAVTILGLPVQTALSITVPTFAVLVGVMANNSRLKDLRGQVDARFNDVDCRFSEMDRRLEERFEDVKETWRAELKSLQASKL